MHAIFEDGSRQYQVSPGELVTVDYREVEAGARLEFGRVLLYRDGDDLRIGQPLVAGLRVIGEVVDFPSIKVYIQRFRRRKNYRRLRGHRQHYTRLKISHILLPGQDVPPPEARSETPAAAPASAPAPEAPAQPQASAPAPEAPATPPEASAQPPQS